MKERIIKNKNLYFKNLDKFNGGFYASDYYEIRNYINKKYKVRITSELSCLLFDVIDLCLSGGFMLGYKYHAREMKRKAKGGASA